jgi:putative Mg2+ transporter-C (MgtC) family protein
MSPDWALQLDLALRLLTAAVLGAAVGFERELHDHPAGMRTHLLVSVGSASFTVLSIYFFSATDDTGRVAAQVVSGIGFLGAGAILKEGVTVKGLTTAASLWAVAAVGMAAGAGAWGVSLATTAIVIFSLWPLGRLTERYIAHGRHRLRIGLIVADRDLLPGVVAAVNEQGGSVGKLASRPGPRGSLLVDLDVRLPEEDDIAQLTAALSTLDGIRLRAATAGFE